MSRFFRLLSFLLVSLLLSTCYYSHPYPSRDSAEGERAEMDSLNFYFTHHYWTGYNFEAVDSLRLLRALPGSQVADYNFSKNDTLKIAPGERLVVARIKIAAPDSGTRDSIWIKVARDQFSQGWISESTLLSNVVPDDPISKFIYHFSGSRTAFVLSALGLALLFWLVQSVRKKRFRIVHFRDIPSFYPTLLCLSVSGAAALYGSIQRFVPVTWVEFYYQPTLNPFNPDIPPILALFIASVWFILIVGVAVLDEVRRQPDLGDTLQYLASLAGVCVVLYLVFSLTTPYYIGYPLLVAYWTFAVYRYYLHRPSHLLCGICGRSIPGKGRCPHCGAINN